MLKSELNRPADDWRHFLVKTKAFVYSSELDIKLNYIIQLQFYCPNQKKKKKKKKKKIKNVALLTQLGRFAQRFQATFGVGDHLKSTKLDGSAVKDLHAVSGWNRESALQHAYVGGMLTCIEFILVTMHTLYTTHCIIYNVCTS